MVGEFPQERGSGEEGGKLVSRERTCLGAHSKWTVEGLQMEEGGG